MAKAQDDGQTYSAPADEWETVSEQRSRIVFDTDGDVWEGYYEGPEDIPNPAYEDDTTGEEPEVFKYLNFRDEAGDGFTTSANFQLNKAFVEDGVPVGAYVRITRTGVTRTKSGRNMTNFKVQTRR